MPTITPQENKMENERRGELRERALRGAALDADETAELERLEAQWEVRDAERLSAITTRVQAEADGLHRDNQMLRELLRRKQELATTLVRTAVLTAMR